ncbi:MAG TPA: hypothetical protein VHE83_02655, partial [Mycobacteriales bacterium]|nr:hypothetical protein [Mycobacteriales bacterium]
MQALLDLDVPVGTAGVDACLDVSVVGSREWLDGQGFATPWDPGSPGWAPGPEMMVRLEDVDVMQLSAA